MLAGLGLAATPRARTAQRAARQAGWRPAVVLVNVESLRAPFTYTVFDGIPGIYRLLATEPGPVVVAEQPFFPRGGIFLNAPYVLASTAHWRPLMNGYSGYTPAGYQRYADAFWYFPEEGAIQAMKDAGVTHVVVHPAAFHKDHQAVLPAIEKRTDFEMMAVGREGVRLYRLKRGRAPPAQLQRSDASSPNPPSRSRCPPARLPDPRRSRVRSRANADVTIAPGTIALVPTGLVIEVPPDHFLGIFARSSTPLKRGLMVANGVGVIDQDYCGPADEVKIQVLNFTAGGGARGEGGSHRAGSVHPRRARGLAGGATATCVTAPAADSGRRDSLSFGFQLPASASSFRLPAFGCDEYADLSGVHGSGRSRGDCRPEVARGGARIGGPHDPHEAPAGRQRRWRRVRADRARRLRARPRVARGVRRPDRGRARAPASAWDSRWGTCSADRTGPISGSSCSTAPIAATRSRGSSSATRMRDAASYLTRQAPNSRQRCYR